MVFEKTIPENTIAWLNAVKPEQVDGTEGKSVAVKMGDRETHFTGLDLLLKRAMPNPTFTPPRPTTCCAITAWRSASAITWGWPTR